MFIAHLTHIADGEKKLFCSKWFFNVHWLQHTSLAYHPVDQPPTKITHIQTVCIRIETTSS